MDHGVKISIQKKQNQRLLLYYYNPDNCPMRTTDYDYSHQLYKIIIHREEVPSRFISNFIKGRLLINR